MRKPAAIIVLIAAFTLSARAQSPPRDAPRPAATGMIGGRVLAAGSDAPLRTARIQITKVGAPRTPGMASVFTDRDGRFVVPSLTAGSYQLTASKSGYVTMSVGAERFQEAGVPVRVADGAAVAVEVRLPKAAAISGRIVDVLGDPMVGAPVTAQVRRSTGPKAEPVTAASTITDDLGDYRLSGLPAGDVFVTTIVGPDLLDSDGSTIQMAPDMALTSMVGNPPNLRPVTVRGESFKTRMYYPGVSNITEAQALTLAAGDEKSAIDLIVPANPPKTLTELVGAPVIGGPRPGANPTGTGAITGRITRADGRALPNAVVRLAGGGPARTTITDQEGRYEFARLAAATYWIRSSKSGFLTIEHGQRRAGDGGEGIDLARGESRQGVDLALPPPGAVMGRVVDDNDDPVEGVSMTVLQIQYENGRRRLVEVSNSFGPSALRRTDDRGQYRIYGLNPGEYVVCARVGQIIPGQEMIDLPGYAPTYYPATSNPNDARFVSVDLSQQLSGVDVALARALTARVAGVRLNSSGEPAGGSLILAPSRRSGSLAPVAVGARTSLDGSFEFPNVTPGEYVLQSAQNGQRSWMEGEFGFLFVTVTGSDITDLTLRTSKGSTISGHITTDGASLPPSRAGFDLRPIPVDLDRAPLVSSQPAHAEIAADWTFELAGANGPRVLRLSNAPEGWMLKAVLLNGLDVTDMPLPFGTGDQSVRDVEVIVTDRASQLSGRVTDRRGIQVGDYTAVVFATDRERWTPASRFVAAVRPGPAGVFVMSALPASEYFVVAADRLQPSEWQDPEFLASIIPSATRITLGAGQKLSVSPRLIVR